MDHLQESYVDSEPLDTSPNLTPDQLESESDSQLPGSPSMSRKRARTSCTSEEIEEMLACKDSSQESVTHSTAVHPSATPVRDDTYYFEDGSFVLQVENTLFNVHRTILSKDSSIFSSMFQLPQGENAVDGMSDDQPLILSGDNVSEFKHFLWALYALPHELMSIHTPQADVVRLVDIARVSYKYHFKSLEAWALDAINDHVNRKDSALFTFPSPSPSGFAISRGTFQANSTQLSQLIRLAQLCDHERLLSTMITLLKRMMSQGIEYAHLAMTLADELDLRTLRGVAYLEVMQKAAVVVRRDKGKGVLNEDGEGADTDIVDSEGRLIVSAEQQLRLLTGYYRLTQAWEKLRTCPIPFDHAASCGATWHQHGCTQSWLEFWKEKTKGETVIVLALSDFLGRLKVIAKEFDRWGSATYMHHDCRLIARKVIQEKIRQVEETLPDFFVEESI
ncbi:hypothetical protein QCA50_015328 [Cerrena zonata]|uniref:BTB domain-containing protein n=1 Tax=Cerrena zonata TaxID=2478898 RepID=A0AAW0FXX3_9APHY